jgi:hypothetical protein
MLYLWVLHRDWQAALSAMIFFAGDCLWTELYFIEHFVMEDVFPSPEALVRCATPAMCFRFFSARKNVHTSNLILLYHTARL